MLEFIVSKSEAGMTVEQFLCCRIPAAPVGYLRQLLKKEKVNKASVPLGAEDILNSGDCIQLPESSRILELLDKREGDIPQLKILHETREILIVNKPPGLAIHAGKGHERKNLTDQIRLHYRLKNQQFQVSPVQRLDLETSGPVLFGKGKKSCSELGKLLMSGDVSKIYLALVAGQLQGQGELLTSIPAKGKMKTAETIYRRIGGLTDATLLELHLKTGRQHQIRRQFAEAGHPLFGDRRYHGPCPVSLKRLFLHCRTLAFTDPFSGEQISITCPLPKDLEQFLGKLNLQG